MIEQLANSQKERWTDNHQNKVRDGCGCFLVLTRATMSASTTGTPADLKRLDTVLFPEAIPPVKPTNLIWN
jgi:hypothetical protein